MTKRSLSTLCFLLAWLAFPTLGTAAYSIVDLGTLGDGTATSSAYGVMYDASTGSINVVGSSSTSANQPQQAFLYSYNIASQTGQMANISPAGSSSSLAFAVSSNGMITGTTGGTDALNPFDSSTPRAFALSSATAPASISQVGTQGFGINSTGTVAGQMSADPNNINGTQHAFVATSSGGTLTAQDIGGGTANSATSYAQGINNSGQVVGQATNSKGVLQATLWNNNGSSSPVGLTSDVNTVSIAKGVNNSGQVVGYQVNGSVDQGLLWKQDGQGNWVQSNVGVLGSTVADTSVLSTRAFSLNASGLVVGEYNYDSNPLDTQAFVYDSDSGDFFNLQSLISSSDPFSLLESAAFIDELGIPNILDAIVGVGLVDINGTYYEHAFLAFDPPTATPEPATLALLGCGLAGLGVFRRRKTA